MEFKPGFRLSKFDMAFIVIAVGAAIALSGISKLLSLYCVFVVAHFFLFCNVVRMSRVPELIWASIFSILAIANYKTGMPSIMVTIIVSLLSTLVLLVLELRKPSYHGVFWQKYNPNLPNWFNAKRQT